MLAQDVSFQNLVSELICIDALIFGAAGFYFEFEFDAELALCVLLRDEVMGEGVLRPAFLEQGEGFVLEPDCEIGLAGLSDELAHNSALLAHPVLILRR